MEQKKVLKKIKLPIGKQIVIATLNTENYFVLCLSNLKKKYIKIPAFIFLSEYERSGGTLVLAVDYEYSDKLAQFLMFLNFWFKSTERPSRKKLVLKGLGYRVSLINDNSVLELKLGFSHAIYIAIPKDEILVKINKQTITLEGHDSVVVGNFAKNIRKLRLPDSYKGKGVWYKNEVKTLKELKKK